MKWIVLAIILSIGAYTFLTLHYRKPGRAFRPYSDLKDRANTKRLLDAGFQRIELQADLPTDTITRDADASIASAAPGIPASLKESLISTPTLPNEIVSVAAASSVSSMLAYPIGFKCTLADNKLQLAGAELYLHGEEIVVTPNFDRLAGGLLTRWKENVVRITIPPGSLKPGRYRVTLVGARSSRAWTLQVH